MRFVDKNARAVRVRDVDQLLQVAEIAVHRINPFHDDEVTPALFPAQCFVERHRIVMLKLICAATRKNSSVAKTQVRAVVENRDIRFAKQSGNRAERAAKSAVEKHRVFAAEKFRDAALQLAMKIGHARE